MTNILEIIERRIDEAGLAVMLADIAMVCEDKRGHIEDNWQDKQTARNWKVAGDQIERLARKLESNKALNP